VKTIYRSLLFDLQSPFVAGIEYKLDYIADLGAKTIWLSPIYKSPMKVFGYDIEDFKDVDESLGSLQDFKDLVQAIRARGKNWA
jgi:glycosidase